MLQLEYGAVGPSPSLMMSERNDREVLCLSFSSFILIENKPVVALIPNRTRIPLVMRPRYRPILNQRKMNPAKVRNSQNAICVLARL